VSVSGFGVRPAILAILLTSILSSITSESLRIARIAGLTPALLSSNTSASFGRVHFYQLLGCLYGAIAKLIKRQLSAAQQLIDLLDAFGAHDESVHHSRCHLKFEAIFR
jgi:hypothetical protein